MGNHAVTGTKNETAGYLVVVEESKATNKPDFYFENQEI
jgi:hypothetical protein